MLQEFLRLAVYVPVDEAGQVDAPGRVIRMYRTAWAGSLGQRLGSSGRPGRRRRMATRADVAIVAIRRPTGTFSGAWP
jgi:hypothetical protein